MPLVPPSLSAAFSGRDWRSCVSALVTGSTNRRILGAAVAVAAMTMAVRAAGMLKELLVAWRFGTGDEIEAFLVAFIVPSMAVSVIGGAFGPALIPTFVRVREQRGLPAARRLYAQVAFWSVLLLAVATLVVVAAAPAYLPRLASGFAPAKLALTERLLDTMAPLVLLSGVAAVCGAILNASESFALPALTPVLPILGTAAGALLAGGVRGAQAMSVGLVAGHLLEAVLLVAALRRAGFGLRTALERPWISSEARFVLGQYLPMVGGSVLMVSTQVVGQAMAAMLPAGSVASLSYGNKIMAVPLNVAVTALGTAVIPYLSAQVARRDWNALHGTVVKYTRLSFLLALAPTAVLALFATPLVRLLFERGAFDAQATRVVAEIQVFASLQIPFYVAGILIVRAISALSSNQILVWGNVVNLTVNVILNLLLMRSLGVSGIALSTSLMYVVSFSFLYVSYKRRLAALRRQEASECA